MIFSAERSYEPAGGKVFRIPFFPTGRGLLKVALPGCNAFHIDGTHSFPMVGGERFDEWRFHLGIIEKADDPRRFHSGISFILSEGANSRREVAMESKHPHPFGNAPRAQALVRVLYGARAEVCNAVTAGPFDSLAPSPSEGALSLRMTWRITLPLQSAHTDFTSV